MLVGMPSTSRPLWSHNEHLYIVMYKAGMLLDIDYTMYTKNITGMLLDVTLKTLIEALVHNTVEMWYSQSTIGKMLHDQHDVAQGVT